jgi:hypothetical protein
MRLVHFGVSLQEIIIFKNFPNFEQINLPYLPMAMVLAGIAPDRNPLLGEQLEVLVRQLSVRGKSQHMKK